MPTKRHLAAVPPGSKPKRQRKPATMKAAAARDERTLLVAMREKVAAEIDKGIPPYTLPAMMRQLRELDREIRALEARTEGDGIVEAASTPDQPFDVEAL